MFHKKGAWDPAVISTGLTSPVFISEAQWSACRSSWPMGEACAVWRPACSTRLAGGWSVAEQEVAEQIRELQQTNMRGSYQLLVLLFLAGLCSPEKGGVHRVFSRPIPGALQNVSKNDTGVKKAVLTGTYSFNNKSNDAFLFKASAVDCAKRQIVKGVRYILEVEISRTVCRKMGHNEDLINCPFQTDSLLRQTFFCHFDVWSIPWMQKMVTEYFNCRSFDNLWQVFSVDIPQKKKKKKKLMLI